MISGSCLCGGIQFEIESFATEIFKCHCSRCRKQFGGASGAAALADETGFSWTRGKELRRKYRPPGSQHDTCFCSTCGSLVPQHLENNGVYYIPMGLLDNSPGIALKRHIHLDSKADWEILDDQTEKLAGHIEL